MAKLAFQVYSPEKDNLIFTEKALDVFKSRGIDYSLEKMMKFFYDLGKTRWEELSYNSQTMIPSNNVFIKRSQELLEQDRLFLRITALYEVFSKISGEKNWNVAKSKNLNFFEFNFQRFEMGITTGLRSLDEVLQGGFNRGNLVTVLGGTNTGKSISTISFACSAIRQGQRVLHISLEGTREETVLRYCSNLGNVPYRDLVQGNIAHNQINLEQYQDQLKIRPMTQFGVTIEDIETVVAETYRTFAFDVLVIDYPALLSSRAGENHSQAMARIYRSLSSLARQYQAVLLAPCQATRRATLTQEAGGVITASEIAESFEIARASSTILTLNATAQERERLQMRIHVDKNQTGLRNQTFTVNTNFSQSKIEE